MMKNNQDRKVSIVVPIYNAEKYIDRCIKSILDQSYHNLQLILINDGSTDHSLQLCQKFAREDGRVEVVSQRNAGVSSARNTGISLADGEFITFVDSDDCLTNSAIETALQYIDMTCADVVVYGWKRIYENSERYEEIIEQYEVVNDQTVIIRKILEHYSAYGGGYPWNKIWRRKTFMNESIPLFDLQLSFFEDLEWVIRSMLCVKRLVVCPKCLYNYSVRKFSVTNTTAINEEKEISYHMALTKIISKIGSIPDLQMWLKKKYYPEIVNGIVHAKRQNWHQVEEYLSNRLQDAKEVIIYSKEIPIKIKIRCVLLLVQLKL